MTAVSAFQGRCRAAAVALVALVAVLVFGAAPAVATEYGLTRFAVSARNANGTPDVQAGSHPYALTTTFITNAENAEGDLKDARLELPPGFVGDPTAVPQCTYQMFINVRESGIPCPNETAVGIATTYVQIKGEPGFDATTDPVYSLVPPTGDAAEFGYIVAGATPVLLQSTVRSGTDYGVNVTAPDLSQAVVIAASKITIWGVPADPRHNAYRGTCERGILGIPELYEGVGFGLREGEDEVEGPLSLVSNHPEWQGTPESLGECSTQAPVRPLLVNPTSCGIPRKSTFAIDDWEEPGKFKSISNSLPELTGCEKLDFSPTLEVTPDGSAGSTPTGVNVDLHVPQETLLNPVGLAEADVKDTTVALPEGVQISPGASDGLQACSEAQIGFTGFKELDPSVEPGVQTAQFNQSAPTCPNASKIANVRIKSPVLEEELTGAVYLAAPQNFAGTQENPFSSLVAIYIYAYAPSVGVVVKLPGQVSLNPVTGRVTTSFENTPALPFTDAHLEFFGTDRAPLTTPALCGTYSAQSSFVPWSGTAAVEPVSSIQVASGPQLLTAAGPQLSPCADPLPFAPSLASGTTNINAGGFSELTTTFSREDGQQSLSSITLHYPPGLSGLLAGAEGRPAVKLCGEAGANEGTCGSESEIGETIVSVGLGNDPFSVRGGKVYLTGPYKGAPFGLSIVNPAKAGPFDLQEGRPVVVRAKVEVDPHTAALTVVTDPPGSPHAIPTMIEGIPLQIKHVNVLVNRPGFTFNPTNCEPTQVTGTVYSSEGASSPVSVPFQVTNCAVLKFAPKFVASTAAKTSRLEGASLHVGLEYPSAPLDTQANIARVKVELPKGLPSRLTTLQKACTAAQFNANPAGCPAASLVGHARATTPLVPVPLEGPAYFVSNGNEAFPNLIVVLQGYGVTIDLVGDTFISKAGVTSSTFKTVPDAPVGSFELTLPEGPYSALTTDGSLCKTKNLVMPTEFVAQNGAEIRQNTKIAVTGCPKGVRHARKKKHTKKKK